MPSQTRTLCSCRLGLVTIAALLLLQACAGTGSTLIDSNPPGATILALSLIQIRLAQRFWQMENLSGKHLNRSTMMKCFHHAGMEPVIW